MTTPEHVGWVTAEETAVILSLRIVPRARRSEIVGVSGENLRVRLAAPPVGGAANRALVAFLARLLDVRKQQISIQSGEHSRQKKVHIDSLTAAEALERLSPLLET